MQTEVLALVILDVDPDLSILMQLLAINRLITLQVGPDQVVCRARRQALSKLSTMIREQLPTRFLLVRPANLHLDTIQRMVVRSPHRTENKCVRLFGPLVNGPSWIGVPPVGGHIEEDEAEDCGQEPGADSWGKHRHAQGPRNRPRAGKRTRLN